MMNVSLPLNSSSTVIINLPYTRQTQIWPTHNPAPQLGTLKVNTQTKGAAPWVCTNIFTARNPICGNRSLLWRYNNSVPNDMFTWPDYFLRPAYYSDFVQAKGCVTMPEFQYWLPNMITDDTTMIYYDLGARDTINIVRYWWRTDSAATPILDGEAQLLAICWDPVHSRYDAFTPDDMDGSALAGLYRLALMNGTGYAIVYNPPKVAGPSFWRDRGAIWITDMSSNVYTIYNRLPNIPHVEQNIYDMCAPTEVNMNIGGAYGACSGLYKHTQTRTIKKQEVYQVWGVEGPFGSANPWGQNFLRTNDGPQWSHTIQGATQVQDTIVDIGAPVVNTLDTNESLTVGMSSGNIIVKSVMIPPQLQLLQVSNYMTKLKMTDGTLIHCVDDTPMLMGARLDIKAIDWANYYEMNDRPINKILVKEYANPQCTWDAQYGCWHLPGVFDLPAEYTHYSSVAGFILRDWQVSPLECVATDFIGIVYSNMCLPWNKCLQPIGINTLSIPTPIFQYIKETRNIFLATERNLSKIARRVTCVLLFS